MKAKVMMEKSRLGRFLKRLLGEEKGAVAMEYIVIALLIGAAVVALVMTFSGSLRNMLGTTTDVVNATSVSDVNAAQKELTSGRSSMKGENVKAKEEGHKIGGDFSGGASGGTGGGAAGGK
jgi:Flp pilus assembly pilin Flp